MDVKLNVSLNVTLVTQEVNHNRDPREKSLSCGTNEQQNIGITASFYRETNYIAFNIILLIFRLNYRTIQKYLSFR